MHGSLSSNALLLAGISNGLREITTVSDFDVLVCPPAAYLIAVGELTGDSDIKLGAQNVNANSEGAFTGEISLSMLTDLGCEYVLIGHSERRELYAESDADIAQKFAACAAQSAITPVLCIGETLAQRQRGDTEAVLAGQLNAALEATGIDGFSNAVIAYEPVWAIGTGETASPEQAQAAHRFIREKLADLDSVLAERVRILYGGSMKPANAKTLLDQPDIDGGLIGGASLQADSFVAICGAAAEVSAA